MKANRINNEIKVFPVLPNEWKHYLNFSLADEEIVKLEGFYDLITPEYNPKEYTLGSIYWDEDDEVYRYTLEKIHYDIEILRQERLDQWEEFQKQFRKEITELYLEEIALGDLSNEMIYLIQVLRQRRSEIYDEINAHADNKELDKLINYNFNTEEVAQFRQMLKELKN